MALIGISRNAGGATFRYRVTSNVSAYYKPVMLNSSQQAAVPGGHLIPERAVLPKKAASQIVAAL